MLYYMSVVQCTTTQLGALERGIQVGDAVAVLRGARGAKGATAPGPTLLVTQKPRGPAPEKKWKRNHRKAFEYTLVA